MSAGRTLARSVYLVFLLGLLLAPVLSSAHAYLVKATPTRRAVLFQAPDRVQLWFNERLEAQFSRLSVWDDQGKPVDLGDARVGADDPKNLSVGVAIANPGVYTVRFRVLSVDGHVVEGEFPFTVRTSR